MQHESCTHVLHCVTWNMQQRSCHSNPQADKEQHLMDIDFTQYNPNDSGDYETLMEIIADNPGKEYDWAKLADYSIEHAWMQFVWGWDDEPADTPRMTTREFTYSNR